MQQHASAAASWSAAAAGGVARPAIAIPPVSIASRIEFEQLIDLVAKCDGTAADPPLQRLLPHVKAWLRGHDELAPLCVELLLSRLRAPQALARINLVRVVDALFMRSRAFRGTLLEHFSTFLQLAVGIGSGAHLHAPKPPEKAKHLQMLSVSCVRNWNDSFGESLQLLRLGCDFMQARVGGMHVPTQFESEQAAEARHTFRRHRTQRLLAVRYARLAAEFETQEGELQSSLSEITNALEILFPRADDAQQLGDYLLRGTEKNESQFPPELQMLKEEPDDTSRPSKRAKRDEGAAGVSAIEEQPPVAAGSDAVTLPSPPVLADSAVDDIEWEDDGAAPSAAAASAIATPPAAAAAPPQPPRSDPAVTSAAQLEGAAAVFGEFQADDSSDSHWWLDEEQDDEQAFEGELGEFDGDAGDDDGGGEWVDEHKDGGSNNDNLTHGIARNYSLSIEFDAHIAVENEDTAPVFQALREAWSRIEKSFLPLLTEWIDTLTRIELDQADLSALAMGASASSAAMAALTQSQLHTLRQQRDSYLKRCVHAREHIHTLRVKCARLGVRISSQAADRNEAVRKETEHTITSAENDEASASTAGVSAAGAARPSATATRSSSSPRAAAASAASSSASADVAAHTRHAANLLGRRAAAEKRAVTKIRSVKRKYAQELEAQRLAARQQPQGEEAAARGGGGSSSDPLRRPFSAAGRIPSAAANIKAEQVDQGEYI